MTDRVEMRLRGRMLEKFVGRALREGVRFQEIEREGAREMRLCASEKDAARLMSLAGEYRMNLTVVGEAGRPLWRRRIRERWTMGLGLLTAAALVAAFSSVIWRVEAVTLDGMTDSATLQAVVQSVSQAGFGPGTLRSRIDRGMLAAQLQAAWPEFTHVSVRLKGVFLRVEVAEEERAPGVYDAEDSRDLIASRDAVVVYVEPLAGKACVKAGDTVRQGQVLIRGEERIDTELTRRIRALGSVIGRVWFSASCEAASMQTERVRTGRKRVSAELRLGNWSMALSEAGDFPCQDVEQERLPVGGLYLPVRIERTIRWEAEEKTVPLDRAALNARLEAEALEKARVLLPDGAEETACWVDFTENNGIVSARATIEAQMDIAAGRTQGTGVFYE